MKRFRMSVELEVFAPDHHEALEEGLKIIGPSHYHQACVRDIDGGECHGDIVNIYRPDNDFVPVKAVPA